MEHVARPEQQKIEQNAEQTIKSTGIELDIPNISEQVDLSPAAQAMPPIEDLSSTPLVSQGEGYGHRVSIDSMIVTPRVPILGEQVPNIGTSTNAEPEEEDDTPNKVYLLKCAVSMVVTATFSIE